MAEKGKANELTYDDFLDRLSIQEVLVDAGYHLNKRDGFHFFGVAYFIAQSLFSNI